MSKTKLNYCGRCYELTFPNEAPAAARFMEQCNPNLLAALIKSDIPLSQGMKDFIADIVTGDLKRKIGARATTAPRDLDIYTAVQDLRDIGETRDAISIVAKELYPGQEKEYAVTEAYKRIKKKDFSKKAR